MYDCQQTREFLGLYIDNELEAALTQAVATHLDQCALCRRELEALRSQNEILARAIKSVSYDTTNLRSLIEAATVRKHALRFGNLSLSRPPAWALAGFFALVLALVGLSYLTDKFGVTLAHPLYQAAANDHLTCSAQSNAPDWIVTQGAVAEKAKPFLHNMNPPLIVDHDYKLVRARLCQLNGETFLHLVYETADGRQASLFVCNPARAIPKGERRLTLNGHDVQSVEVSEVHITSMLEGDCLLIAAAREDSASVALLRSLMS